METPTPARPVYARETSAPTLADSSCLRLEGIYPCQNAERKPRPEMNAHHADAEFRITAACSPDPTTSGQDP